MQNEEMLRGLILGALFGLIGYVFVRFGKDKSPLPKASEIPEGNPASELTQLEYPTRNRGDELQERITGDGFQERITGDVLQEPFMRRVSSRDDPPKPASDEDFWNDPIWDHGDERRKRARQIEEEMKAKRISNRIRRGLINVWKALPSWKENTLTTPVAILLGAALIATALYFGLIEMGKPAPRTYNPWLNR